MQVLDTASATAVGGRQGHIRSADGVPGLSLAHPEEFGGPGGAATNPEQPFAAGYAACFETALLRKRKPPVQPFSVIAHAGIGREADGFFRLRVALSVPGGDWAEAMTRIAHAEVCPYFRARRGTIEIEVRAA